MALIGNRSVLNKSPGRFLSGTVASGDRSSFNKHGMCRSAFQAFSPLSAMPNGARSPIAWVMAKTNGGMSSSREASLSLAATGAAVMGLPSSGSAAISIAVADLVGQLISSGSGTASFSIYTNTPQLTALISGSGSANISVTTNSPVLGAIGWCNGSANISVTAGPATAYPLDDTPQTCSGSATISITGSLVPYAVGHMSGSTASSTELTPQSIAQSVWGSVATESNTAGTMGSKLNTASSGGVDMEALAASVWAHAIEYGYSAEEVLKIISATLAGDATGLEGPAPTFTAIDGSRQRVSATYLNGVRTVTLDAA